MEKDSSTDAAEKQEIREDAGTDIAQVWVDEDNLDAAQEEATEEEETKEESGTERTMGEGAVLDVSALKAALLIPPSMREQKLEQLLGEYLTNAAGEGNDRVAQMIGNGRRQGIPASELARNIIVAYSSRNIQDPGSKIAYFPNTMSKNASVVMEKPVSYGDRTV